MTEEPTGSGWFEAVDPSGLDGACESIEHGSTESPEDWPTRAVEAGFAADVEAYYDLLHEATTSVTRDVVRDAEMEEDQQLIVSIRAMDDCERVANELAERATAWAGSLLGVDVAGVEGAREVAAHGPSSLAEERLVSLARQVDSLAAEGEELRTFVERRTPAVAPNLAAMAGPVLAARLIALAGGLGDLARMPSGTVQVLGAEDALFAHLRGQGTSPKHGVIFTHDYVRNTAPAERGSAARALAGKLTIAARVDHYSGELRPELQDEIDERIRRVRTRGGDA